MTDSAKLIDRDRAVAALRLAADIAQARADQYFTKYINGRRESDSADWTRNESRANGLYSAASIVSNLDEVEIDLGDATEGDPRYTVWIAHVEFRNLTAEQVEALDIDLDDVEPQ